MDHEEANAQAAEETVDKKKAKRDKVRSAWISFAGRIVAQIVGAIATVALGVMVLHRYTSNDTRTPAHEGRSDAYAQPAHPDAAGALGAAPTASGALASQPVHVIVLTPAMLGLPNADQRFWPADRTCTPQLDGPSTSTAHLDNGTFLSR